MAPCRTGPAAAACTWSSGLVDGRDARRPRRLSSRCARSPQAKSVLVVVDEGDELTWLSLRNAPEVHLLDAGQLNTYDVLCHDDVVFTQEAYDQVVAGV